MKVLECRLLQILLGALRVNILSVLVLFITFDQNLFQPQSIDIPSYFSTEEANRSGSAWFAI